MKLKVKYFGALAEETKFAEELLELGEEQTDLGELIALCESKHPGIATLSYQVSVNKKLVSDAKIQEGDEVAFLPPFAGG